MSNVSIAEIAAAVADRFNLDPATLTGPSKRRKAAWPRHIAMWIALLDGTRSSVQVGIYFKRDHTSILYARGVISRWVEEGHPMGIAAAELAEALGVRRGLRVVPVNELSNVKQATA